MPGRASERKPRPRAFAMTWRDLIMFGCGALGSLLVILLARLLVALLP